MPIEAVILDLLPSPFAACPECGAAPFEPFLRGQVQRMWPWTWRTLWLPIGEPQPYCALICRECKEIVGYE